METKNFQLKVLNGNEANSYIGLENDIISLGSGSTFSATDVRITFVDESMASEHAVLLWQKKENTYLISNRSIMNPIQVNKTPCRHALLIPGMIIRIGNTELEVIAKDYKGMREFLISPAELKCPDDIYLEEQSQVTCKRHIPVWLTTGQVQEVATSIEDVPPMPPATDSPKLLGELKVIKGTDKGKTLDVYNDVMIGRNPECDLSLSDAQVSRQHCSITFEDDKVWLTNLSSSNTTKLNRDIIDKAELPSEADIILSSKVILRWVAL